MHMTRTVAALYVDPRGHYFGRPDVDPWDEARDARRYSGSAPVVAHPPCDLWVNLAAVNWKRYGRQLPAWYPGGDDRGCFAAALAAVRRWGGVLEHPGGTHAWAHHGLPRPPDAGWQRTFEGEWVCEVRQAAYGHRARKRTWLFYVGERPPFELNWDKAEGTHQCGFVFGKDGKRPYVGKREARATPLAFAEVLIQLARGARQATGADATSLAGLDLHSL